jgi:hypothetical protein
MFEVLFAVSLATSSVDPSLSRLADGGHASVLSSDNNDTLVFWAFADLALSVEEGFSLDGTDSADAIISSSDFIFFTGDFGTDSVDHLVTVEVTWLSDTSLFLEIEEFKEGTSRNAVFSLKSESWLTRNDFTSLSVPVASGGTSVDTGSSDSFLVSWAFDLNAFVVFLNKSVLALDLEASVLLKNESFLTGDSLAFVINDSEELFAFNFETSVVSLDLSGWASDFNTSELSFDDLRGISGWAFSGDANSVLFGSSSWANKSWGFLLFVAFISDEFESLLASDVVVDYSLNALTVLVSESEWTGNNGGSVSLSALESLFGPSDWAVLDTGLVLVVSESSWAFVGDLVSSNELGVVLVPKGVEFSSLVVNLSVLDGPS